MQRMIRDNLFRQAKGMELLESLLLEEYELLRTLDPQGVTHLEFSIQELMQQLVAERTRLKKMLQGKKLVQYIAFLRQQATAGRPELAGQADELAALFKRIDTIEQSGARQAEKNTQLVLALMDQNSNLLDFLQKKVTPQQKDAYSAAGKYKNARPEAALIRGRL